MKEVKYLYASDMQETNVTNGWGPLEKDMNVGQLELGDGQPLSVGGKPFAKGLGLMPPQALRTTLPDSRSICLPRLSVLMMAPETMVQRCSRYLLTA